MSTTGNAITGYPKPTLRRIMVPIGLVLGTFFCGYAALFVGVKEDLPAPTQAVRFPLSVANQNIVREQFPDDTKNYKSPDIAVYLLRDTPQVAADYWRNAFVTRRNWKELSPPSQPKDGAGLDFQMLGFNRAGSKVILAITTADKLLATDNKLTQAIKSANYRAGDTVAIMIVGDLK